MHSFLNSQGGLVISTAMSLYVYLKCQTLSQSVINARYVESVGDCLEIQLNIRVFIESDEIISRLIDVRLFYIKPVYQIIEVSISDSAFNISIFKSNVIIFISLIET